jgi:hypothetical protein
MGCQDSIKSTTYYIFMLAGRTISWKSVKQSLVVFSTIEVEFIAYF